MDIKIDAQQVEKAINEQVGKAIADALSGYDVRQAIAKSLSTEIAEGAIHQALKRATANLDLERLTATLASEIERAATASTVGLLQESFVSVVAKLRNISEYGDEYKRERTAIRMELFGITGTAAAAKR